jgi:DNA-binding response OmpR family regulator
VPNRTILVIDDSPLIRTLVQVALGGDCGWAVKASASGADGIELAARERPDAILLDVEMPDLNGPATLSGLRAQQSTSEVPVLFLTAHSPLDHPELTELGAAGVIAKPFELDALATQIAGALGW